MATPVSQAIRERHEEVLVLAGAATEAVAERTALEDLGVPTPDYHLGVISGSRGSQMADVMLRLEEILLAESPDLVLVRGGSNVTLAAALAASQLDIRVAHIEAGQRSFHRMGPEETNRLVTDHVARLHLCASRSAVRHLASEGIIGSAYWVGDAMLDARRRVGRIAKERSHILDDLGLVPRRYALAAIERREGFEDQDRVETLAAILRQAPERVVLLAQPRLVRKLTSIGDLGPNVLLPNEWPGVLDRHQLEENARLIVTDSGDVQRAAYHAGVPCLTLWPETEWVETVEAGWNVVVGLDAELVLRTWSEFRPPSARPPVFGDGRAGERIASLLEGESVESRWDLFASSPATAFPA
ncbi:MAG TPA: UDP-N-acetylglucosamine 2-epimerase [Anaerolineales bacterium]|nr:UDP-N-acetylglucosamine 2-epimerase [Anaerolineales bacterium]